MARMLTSRPVVEWLLRRPGTFEAPTERAVWRKAWQAFSEGRFDQANDFLFIMYVKEARFDVRPTALGGYILDATR